MNDDVLPGLLKEVQAKFEAEFGKSKVVEDAFKKLKAKRQPILPQTILRLKLVKYSHECWDR